MLSQFYTMEVRVNLMYIWYWILYICKYREQEKIKNVMSAHIGNAVQISLGEIISVKIFFFLLGLPF